MQSFDTGTSIPSITTINPQNPAGLSTFTRTLTALLNELENNFTQLVILCIGSDRSTGDALGPLVGSMLKELRPGKAIIQGTLTHPVHALNLEETRSAIKNKYNSAAILAIDAGLGNGKVSVL